MMLTTTPWCSRTVNSDIHNKDYVWRWLLR